MLDQALKNRALEELHSRAPRTPERDECLYASMAAESLKLESIETTADEILKIARSHDRTKTIQRRSDVKHSKKKPPEDPGVLGILSPEQQQAMKLAAYRVTRDIAESPRIAESWTFSFILGVHRQLFDQVDMSCAGIIRTSEVQLRDYPVPSPGQIMYRLEDVVHFAQTTVSEALKIVQEDGKIDFVFTRAASFHAACVITQPFVDGNKRWARQLLSALLVDCGFVPGAEISATLKERYMTEIGRSALGNANEFAEMILEGWIALRQKKIRGNDYDTLN